MIGTLVKIVDKCMSLVSHTNLASSKPGFQSRPLNSELGSNLPDARIQEPDPQCGCLWEVGRGMMPPEQLLIAKHHASPWLLTLYMLNPSIRILISAEAEGMHVPHSFVDS